MKNRIVLVDNRTFAGKYSQVEQGMKMETVPYQRNTILVLKNKVFTDATLLFHPHRHS